MRLIDADAIPWFIKGIGVIPVIAKEEIDEMPTVDPVKHGRWITPWGHENARVCLQCKMICHADNATFYAYCPNCGAKMDAERKDNEEEGEGK